MISLLFAAAHINKRIIDVTPYAGSVYKCVVDETGAAQEECIYSCLLATRVVGEVSRDGAADGLGALVCVNYLADASDALVTTSAAGIVKVFLDKRHGWKT